MPGKVKCMGKFITASYEGAVLARKTARRIAEEVLRAESCSRTICGNWFDFRRNGGIVEIRKNGAAYEAVYDCELEATIEAEVLYGVH